MAPERKQKHIEKKQQKEKEKEQKHLQSLQQLLYRVKHDGHFARSIESRFQIIRDIIGKRSHDVAQKMCTAIRSKNTQIAFDCCLKIKKAIEKKKNLQKGFQTGGKDSDKKAGGEMYQQIPEGHFW